MTDTKKTITKDGTTIAYRHHEGSQPGFVCLTGYRSDMNGGKVTAMEEFCKEQGIQFTCFDYRGHGQSFGDFDLSSVGDWIGDTLHIIDEVTQGPQVLIGSSMGGHMMVQAALNRPDRVAGLIGIASAPDFFDLMQSELSEQEQLDMEQTGIVSRNVGTPEEPFEYRITKHMLDEGPNHRVLDKASIPITCPAILLHGRQDEVVSYQRSELLKERLESDDVEVRLNDSDHRFSSEDDLVMLKQAATDLLAKIKQLPEAQVTGATTESISRTGQGRS